jgi:hypothetical protein
MTWTIRSKDYSGHEKETNHEFANESVAINYAHSLQFHPNSLIIIAVSNSEGRQITGKELDALLSKVAN